MLKHIVLASAMMFCLPTASHAMSKKPKSTTLPGGADRPTAQPKSPPTRPESADCSASKAFAKGVRDESQKALNSAVNQPSNSAASVEISFHNCRQTYAQEAISVAEISVCGGYLSQAQMRERLAANLKECDTKRAADKLALSKGLEPARPEQMPAARSTGGGSSSESASRGRAASSNGVQ